MTTIVKIDTLEEFEKLKSVWNKLIEFDEHPTIFKTFEWVNTWWHSFGQDHSMFVLVIRSGNDIVGIAPMMLSEQSNFGRRTRTIRFLGTPEADYCDFLGANKELVSRCVIDYLMENDEDWTNIELSQISERSKSVQFLRDYLHSQNCSYRLRVIETCPMFIFDGDDQERANFNPKRGKTLRNHFNYLNQGDSLELIEILDAEQIGSYLFSFFHYHIMRWGETSTPSRFLDSRHRDFYLDLSRTLAPSEGVSLLVLKKHNIPIAFKFNFSYRGTIFNNTPTHSLFYDTRSPGAIINDLSRRYYIKKGYNLLDFSRGEHPHKKGVSNRRFDNYQLQIYKSRISLRLEIGYNRLKQFAPISVLLSNPRFRKIKNRITYAHASHGVMKLISSGISGLLRLIVDRSSVTLFEDVGLQVPSFDLPKETMIEKLGLSDVIAIATFYGIRGKSKRFQVFKEHLKSNIDCFAVCQKGAIVAILWGITDQVIFSGVEGIHKLADNEVLLCDGFVSPVYDDAGEFYGALLVHTIKLYREKRRRILMFCTPDYKIATDIMAVTKFKKLRVMRSLRVLGVRIK